MYKCGFQQGISVDSQRTDWSGDSPRPLVWNAWYPCAADATEAETVDGPADKAIFRLGNLARDANLSEERQQWPIVLLSHGTGGTVGSLGWLAGSLATRGFIVLGVNHHGNTGIEPYRAEGFYCWWERAEDLTVILDKLGEVPSFTGRIDLKNVFAAGFSLGAYTVLSLAGARTSLQQFRTWIDSEPLGQMSPREFPELADRIPSLMANSDQLRNSVARHSLSFYDERILAIAAIAPPPPVRAFTTESLRQISIPTKIIASATDVEAPYELCAQWLKEKNDRFDMTLLDGDVDHYSFLGHPTRLGFEQCPDLFRDVEGTKRADVHKICLEEISDHFKRAIEKTA